MSWKGWIVVIILALVFISHPALITQVINALTTFINGVTTGLSNANLGGTSGG